MKKQTRTRSGSAFCMGELARMAGEAARGRRALLYVVCLCVQRRDIGKIVANRHVMCWSAYRISHGNRLSAARRRRRGRKSVGHRIQLCAMRRNQPYAYSLSGGAARSSIFVAVMRLDAVWKAAMGIVRWDAYRIILSGRLFLCEQKAKGGTGSWTQEAAACARR